VPKPGSNDDAIAGISRGTEARPREPGMASGEERIAADAANERGEPGATGRPEPPLAFASRIFSSVDCRI